MDCRNGYTSPPEQDMGNGAYLDTILGGKNKLLDLDQLLAGPACIFQAIAPFPLAHGDPLAAVEEGMGGAPGEAVGGGGGVEEGGVLDGGEDVEVRERADDAEEDDGLDGCVRCVQRKGAKQGAHGG